jgi:hypothetical protein
MATFEAEAEVGGAADTAHALRVLDAPGVAHTEQPVSFPSCACLYFFHVIAKKCIIHTLG